jgi:arginyl-tRNA--protein-N-Asp/Glu arginylyltransferase
MDDVDILPSVKGAVLDDYLSRGWFRIGCMMYTTDVTTIGNKQYPVYWLRYNVQKAHLCKKNRKLVTSNSHFAVTCQPLILTSEIEHLFKKYKKGISFILPNTLDAILIDDNCTTFDSVIMTVRDNGLLIAVGIFDVGTSTIQDIVNFYDPAYRRSSLGKYLMLSKYQYCLENGYDYYYPGYYLPRQEVMSYKLFLDAAATEVYLPDGNIWISHRQFETTAFK